MKRINKKYIKKAVKIFGNVISILSIAFIIRAVMVLGFDFSTVTNWPMFIGIVVLCSLAKGVTVFMSGTAWYRWLCFFSKKKASRKEALRVYSKANIGKYLPGNVMHYVERNLFAGKLGISQKKLAISSLMEVFTLASSATLLALVLSASSFVSAVQKIIEKIGIYTVAIIFAAIVVGGATAVVLLYKRIINILREYSLVDFVKTLCGNIALYALVQLVLGLLMVVLFWYMGGETDLKTFGVVISGYIIAWVLGFIVPGAPGGMGVREMVITLLLGGVMGQSMVVTLSIAHRLITIIGDFEAYWFGIVCLSDKNSAKSEAEND